jgi:hypothetical protein
MEILGLMSDKEIRIRLPVEELDVLLEPIKSKNQIAEEQKEEYDSSEEEINSDNYNVEDMDQSSSESDNNVL